MTGTQKWMHQKSNEELQSQDEEIPTIVTSARGNGSMNLLLTGTTSKTLCADPNLAKESGWSGLPGKYKALINQQRMTSMQKLTWLILIFEVAVTAAKVMK
jgi:hypothetical protein